MARVPTTDPAGRFSSMEEELSATLVGVSLTLVIEMVKVLSNVRPAESVVRRVRLYCDWAS